MFCTEVLLKMSIGTLSTQGATWVNFELPFSYFWIYLSYLEQFRARTFVWWVTPSCICAGGIGLSSKPICRSVGEVGLSSDLVCRSNGEVPLSSNPVCRSMVEVSVPYCACANPAASSRCPRFVLDWLHLQLAPIAPSTVHQGKL